MDYYYKYQKYKQKYNNMSGGLFKYENSVLKFDFSGPPPLYTHVTQYYYRNESGEIVELIIPNEKLDEIKQKMESCISAIKACRSKYSEEDRIKKCRSLIECKKFDIVINTNTKLEIIQYVNKIYEVLYILFVIINEKKFQLYSLNTANRVIINKLLNIIYEKLKSQLSQSKPITKEEFLQDLLDNNLTYKVAVMVDDTQTNKVEFIKDLLDNDLTDNEQMYYLVDFVYSYIENPTIKHLIIEPLSKLLTILTSSTITEKIKIEEKVEKLKKELELKIKKQEATV